MINSRGSEWRRWDPHIHAPGTALNDQFKGDWDAYLKGIEEKLPTVEALGITDYFSIRTYREVDKQKASGRLPNVGLIFPNVEMRLDIKTEKKKGINLHLLFSPADPNHMTEIERILGNLSFEFNGKTYQCTPEQLIALGKAFNPKQTDEMGALSEGANQFKTSLTELRKIFRAEQWLEKNCLVAVAGSISDGTSGLQSDDSFAATRLEIERFAQIIFSGSPSQRDYWLGKKPGFDRNYIENKYGFLKPCLHGSDAHYEEQILEPDQQRYCWLKGDLTFETLRQAVIEPETRVWIGDQPPANKQPSIFIDKVKTKDSPWLQTDELPLNAGLVAIIGARGSGKTALVDIVAAGAHSLASSLDESSFLKRASDPIDYLGQATVDLSWSDGSLTTESLLPFYDPDVYSEACYLSQHFVNRLCSAEGLATDLRDQMERVIFESTDQTKHFGTDSFDELRDFLLSPIKRRRDEFDDTIRSTSDQIVQEDILRSRLPALKKEQIQISKQLQNDRAQQRTLLPKGEEQRAKQLMQLEQACNDSEGSIEILRRREKTLLDLEGTVKDIREYTEPNRLREMREDYAEAKLSDTEWEAFGLIFKGDVDQILTKAKAEAAKAISTAVNGDPQNPIDTKTAPVAQWSLNQIRSARDALKKQVGIDADKRKKYEQLQAAITKQGISLQRTEAEIKHAEGAAARRSGLIDSRRKAYEEAFLTLDDEEKTLADLYAPLGAELAGRSGALSKLQFIVRREVDLEAWVEKGEQLLDLRKDMSFRGHGALREATEKLLLSAWKNGTASEVATAMDSFRSTFTKDLLAAKPPSVGPQDYSAWTQSIALWLYDTSHISIEYGIHYDGVPIEQLSPGTRGIVLLLLYLAIDRYDRRPLIIDQPEENLDPKSVYDELVPHFRDARQRRQVIVVTHNANLVVNTDADQVIVANSTRTAGTGLPTITYEAGGLEDPHIRGAVCQILEGGERAFLERERRYRLHWGETMGVPTNQN